MATVFKDRQSTYPNRYKVTTDSGESYYVTLERADEPTEAGTPLNAVTFNTMLSELNSHTHNYAGSSSAGGAATSANKLNTNAGDSNTPVYFSGGIPVKCTSLDLSTTGNAATATKLATARTIRTNLASTSTASFDGSAAVTPGVTGTLAVGNGGTGSSNGATGLKNLLAAGNTVLSSYQYGTSLPTAGTKGRIFFKKVST